MYVCVVFPTGLIEFSLTELEVATHHFSTIVGQGGFATVYKVTPYASLACSVLEASQFNSVFSNCQNRHVGLISYN